MKTTKLNTLAIGLFLYATLFLGLVSQAAAPATFGVQGKLLDSEGVVVADGEYNFLVALGDDNLEEPTVFWPEDGSPLAVDAVSVVNGVYNFNVGPVDPAILADNDVNLWIWVNEEALGPQGVASVPYAIVAGLASSVVDGSITSASIADGAVSLAKLDEGVGLTLAAVPELELSLAATNDELAATNETLADTKGTVDTLKEVVNPTWDGTQDTYTIVLGIDLDEYDPAFSVYGPALMDPLTGLPVNAPVVSIIAGELPDGVTYDADTNEIDGTPTETGIFDITLEATDLLGQTVTKDVSIVVIDVDLSEVTLENISGINAGPVAHGGSVIAGDELAFSFDALDTDGNIVDVSSFDITWEQNGDEIGSAASTTLEIVAKKLDSGYVLPMVNHQGFYSASVEFDWGVELTTDAIYGVDDDEDFLLATILDGFVIEALEYDGGPGPAEIEAAEDSENFTVDRNFFAGFNGTAKFQWYSRKDLDNDGYDEDDGDYETAIPGAIYESFSFDNAVQIVDGRATFNGNTSPDELETTEYFVVIHNTFADQVSDDWTPAIPAFINDNINIYSALPGPASPVVVRTENAGYPMEFSVSAITPEGDLSYVWSWDAIGAGNNEDEVDFGTDNDMIIPGANLKDQVLAVGDPDYNLYVKVTSPFSYETDMTQIIVNPDLVQVPAGVTSYDAYDEDASAYFVDQGVYVDDTNGPEADAEVFVGIMDPNDDAIALEEEVVLGEDVTMIATVYIPSALLSDEDDGSFTRPQMVTGPDRPVTVRWRGTIDGQTTTLPASDVSVLYTFVRGDQLVPAETNRIGIQARLFIENAQIDDNNVATGLFWAEIETEYGTFTSTSMSLTVVEPAP